MNSKKIGCIIVMLAMVITLGSGYSAPKASAAGAYQIRVNKQKNCVTIYKLNASGKYKPVKALICSTGYATEPGTYSLGEKMRWHVLDGPCYGQYCTRIYGGVLFHSVWYTGENNPSTLSVSSYNKLGTTASHGCVRLTVAGAKWIYDNVPSGTQVIVYNGSKPGPLGKPESIQLPYSTPWDPTDTGNPSNPWNKKKPVITGAVNQEVDYNASFNVKKGVKAINTTGFNATSRIKVQITYGGKKVKNVDTSKPGTYKVKYKVKDEIGRKASKTVKIKVTSSMNTPKISGQTNLYVQSKSKLTKTLALKNVKITQDGKKLAKKYIKVTYKKIKKNVYRVTYTAQKASEPAVATVTAYVDATAPKITGVVNGSTYDVASTQKVDKAYAQSLIKVSDNVSKLTVSDVGITITAEENGAKHKVVYTLKDQAGNKTTVTIYLQTVQAQTPAAAPTILGAKDMTIATTALGHDGDVEEILLQSSLSAYLLTCAGITAKAADGTDLTGAMTVTLTAQGVDNYQAIFNAKDAAGTTVTQTIKVSITRDYYINYSGVSDQNVTYATLGIESTADATTVESAVKTYVENMSIKATDRNNAELKVSVTVATGETAGTYVIMLTASDSSSHTRKVVMLVTVSAS